MAPVTRVEVDIRAKLFRGEAGRPAHQALREVRFSVGPEEFVCVVGPSGCGKTTLLNIIAGLDRDFDGRVEHHQAMSGLGYVFQSPRLLPWRTVRENIEIAVFGGEDRSAPIDELLCETGLQDFRDVYPNRLSLGMQRRAALVRAFAIRPSLLLLDEPLVSLDEATADRLRHLMLELIRRHPAPVLYVTHNLEEAAELGTRVIVLSASPARLLANIVLNKPHWRRSAEEVAAITQAIRRAALSEEATIPPDSKR